MKRHAPLLLACVLTLSLVPRGGQAQPKRATVSARAAAQARMHFKAGKEAYAAGQYVLAAEAFLEGYKLDPKPAFLINIAQSYRQADDLKQAAHYCEEHLRLAPDSPLRSQVEGLVDEIRREIMAREEANKPKPRPLPLVVAPPVRPPPPPPPTPFYKTWWFWTGVAVVVVGTSVGVGFYAGTREPDYVKEGGLGSVSW